MNRLFKLFSKIFKNSSAYAESKEYTDFLEIAFSSGYSFTNEYGNECKYYSIGIGQLNILNGEIIACDPFLFYDEKPFLEKFPIGKFPVELAIERQGGDERIGFARIKFYDTIPVKWEPALIEGQKFENISGDHYFGYPVDSGTGSFMDSSGMVEYSKKYDENENYFFDEVIAQLNKTYKHTRSWLLWESNGKNVALFSSGLGDGMYETQIGFDINGNICRLVTDFGLIDLSN
jgi:hypothetical protein